jgi:phosphoserine phosphatase RsbX
MHPAIEWGQAARALSEPSGDVAVVHQFDHGVLVAVVDGLGHGPEAANAAQLAAEQLTAHAGESVIALLRRAHTRLKGTRGVVMSIASFNTRDDTMTWIGVGNVEGILLRAEPASGSPRESILLRGGVVGYDLPAMQASVVTVNRGDTLAFATDGLRSEFISGVRAAVPPSRQAADLLTRYGKATDDALILVARYLGAT